MYANELVALQPNAILVDSAPGTSVLFATVKQIRSRDYNCAWNRHD
jgi:hypothetical protein